MISSDDPGWFKRFWAYIKNKRCDNTGVASLLKDGVLHSESKAKATLLNAQFSSVFTEENLLNLPHFDASPHPVIGNLDINHIGVEKQLLSQLKPHKASGPDALPARLLKECSVQLHCPRTAVSVYQPPRIHSL